MGTKKTWAQLLAEGDPKKAKKIAAQIKEIEEKWAEANPGLIEVYQGSAKAVSASAGTHSGNGVFSDKVKAKMKGKSLNQAILDEVAQLKDEIADGTSALSAAHAGLKPSTEINTPMMPDYAKADAEITEHAVGVPAPHEIAKAEIDANPAVEYGTIKDGAVWWDGQKVQEVITSYNEPITYVLEDGTEVQPALANAQVYGQWTKPEPWDDPNHVPVFENPKPWDDPIEPDPTKITAPWQTTQPMIDGVPIVKAESKTTTDVITYTLANGAVVQKAPNAYPHYVKGPSKTVVHNPPIQQMPKGYAADSKAAAFAAKYGAGPPKADPFFASGGVIPGTEPPSALPKTGDLIKNAAGEIVGVHTAATPKFVQDEGNGNLVNGNLVANPAVSWDDPDADPLGDLYTFAKKFAKAHIKPPSEVVMSPQMEAALKTAALTKDPAKKYLKVALDEVGLDQVFGMKIVVDDGLPANTVYVTHPDVPPKPAFSGVVKPAGINPGDVLIANGTVIGTADGFKIDYAGSGGGGGGTSAVGTFKNAVAGFTGATMTFSGAVDAATMKIITGFDVDAGPPGGPFLLDDPEEYGC